MIRGRDSVRDKLETMWFFHRRLVVKLVVVDSLLAIILYQICQESLGILPMMCVPSFSILNFFVAGGGRKAGNIRLPLSLFVSFIFSTLVTLATGSPVETGSASRAVMGGWINTAFLVFFTIVTVCTGYATYVLWSETEMDYELRRHHRRWRR